MLRAAGCQRDISATPTRARAAGGRSNAAALPGEAGLQGAVPHAREPRPGLSARRRAGEGRAAGRGVHEDVAGQQAVEAAKHVHRAAGEESADVRLSEGSTAAAFPPGQLGKEAADVQALGKVYFPRSESFLRRLGDSYRSEAGCKLQTQGRVGAGGVLRSCRVAFYI